MAKKKESKKVVKEGGKWLVKQGKKVLGRFGNEKSAKEWVKN